MRIAIWSDIHLGQRMYRTDENNVNKYELAGYKALKKYVKAISDSNPDLVINAGDVFDKPNPLIPAIHMYKMAQEKLSSFKTMTITGNHDFNFYNKRNKCCAAAMAKHTYFADYEIKTVELDGILFVMMPYIYDTDENIQAYMKQAETIAEQSKCSKKILVTHGVTEKYYRESFIGDAIMLSDYLVSLYDCVIIGHIHTPFSYKQDNTLVISPGAMIDYQAYTDRTGPIILDTDTMTFERIPIKTPHIIKKECNESNINDLLRSVDENIYNISYKGDTEAIDNELFINAKNVAINLVITPIKEETAEEEDTTSTTILDIYTWVANNRPELNDEFIKAKPQIGGK